MKKFTSIELFNKIYERYESDFVAGKILISGSVLYSLLNIDIDRNPGDIDLILDLKDQEYQAFIARDLENIKPGIKGFQFRNVQNTLPYRTAITHVVNHKSGVRIEVGQNDLTKIYPVSLKGYSLYIFDPTKAITDLALYFPKYLYSYNASKRANNASGMAIMKKKTEKILNNIHRASMYYGLDFEKIDDNEFKKNLSIANDLLAQSERTKSVLWDLYFS